MYDIFRTPSKQKSPKKLENISIVDLLRGHDPKDYERILREHGIHDYRAILQAVEFLKREKEMETGKAVLGKTDCNSGAGLVCNSTDLRDKSAPYFTHIISFP